MFSRLVCTVGRLAPATGRVGLWRPLSTCQPRFTNDTPQPVSTSGRTGLAGFLESKTGVTGAGTLGVGMAAYLISKEIYIINNETVVVVVVGGVIYYLLKKMGPPITQYIDERNQKIQDRFYGFHNAQIKEVEDAIVDQQRLDGNLEVRHDIFSVLRENNAMQLEEEYRRRWHEVITEVTRRLDYQVC
ncbi:ATP synthase F(0) complex subunit B1, mitochondrial [Geodia barretti]|uniref:ATP synthase subunit b n=1 Tax=Geodia barretti TaxID=519541 RepID=A0AA35WNN0_GEOBA|nr:ATP synthase F(0) complex subunit B1, mitochondrial [Geodia barretti]